MAAATVAPPGTQLRVIPIQHWYLLVSPILSVHNAGSELTRFIGNCCPDHGCRTSSRVRTTVVVVVVVIFLIFFYGTSHPTSFFYFADFASLASDVFFVIVNRASSTASLHAHYLLFELYPAPWTLFNISVTNFLHPTIVTWVVHWTADLSSASLLHPINFFILHRAANFSSASSLYRFNIFILHWAANFSPASALYRINFFIIHWAANFSSPSPLHPINFFVVLWTANSPSVYHLHPTKFFVVHWTANRAAFFVNRASNWPSFILPSWIMPSVFLPYRTTDYCDDLHLQYDWVPEPVWILYTLASAVRIASTNYSHRNSVLPFADDHL
ncbi:hypothetical protein KC315_g827 [Hortaea werneckii]|nr:hypothetical protein KC315_g827 [Hortaea werneckii]